MNNRDLDELQARIARLHLPTHAEAILRDAETAIIELRERAENAETQLAVLALTRRDPPCP